MASHTLPVDAPILVVDDEFLVVLTLRNALEDMGFEHVEMASSVKGATDLLDRTSFRFVLLDINLGGTRSLDFARSLEDRGVPFAFVTGYGRPGLEGRFQDVPVIPKPLPPGALEDIIRTSD